MKQHASETDEVGQITIDFTTRTVNMAGHQIRLIKLEYRLLEYLFRHKDEAYISCDSLVKFLWPDGESPQGEGKVKRMAHIMVDRTRRAIGITQKQNDLPRTTYIHTVWEDGVGKGFRLKVVDQQDADLNKG